MTGPNVEKARLQPSRRTVATRPVGIFIKLKPGEARSLAF